jgi:hypothetical protein
MLGLPSTTDIPAGGKKIPKEAFYRNLNPTGKIRESFTKDIEEFRVVNSIKPATANVLDGDKVHEVMVLRVVLKTCKVPQTVLQEIAKQNPHKLIFLCVDPTDKECLAVKIDSLVTNNWQQPQTYSLAITGNTLDEAWDSLVSQVVFGDTGIAGISVKERYAKYLKITNLEEEIASLDKRCRKEKQYAKKNALFAKLKTKKEELKLLKEGN